MGNIEELLELARRQLKVQRIISICLAVVVVLLLAVGGLAVRSMERMTASMELTAEKIQEIDVEEINDTISSTNELLESVERFSEAVDQVTKKMGELDSWISGLF